MSDFELNSFGTLFGGAGAPGFDLDAFVQPTATGFQLHNPDPPLLLPSQGIDDLPQTPQGTSFIGTQPHLDMRLITQLTGNQLVAAGNSDVKHLLATAQQLRSENKDLRTAVVHLRGQVSALERMVDRTPAPVIKNERPPHPWELPIEPFPELDPKEYPHIHNWMSFSSPKRGTSTGTEAPVIADPDSNDIVQPQEGKTGRGRGQHPNKRTNAAGEPNEGPSKWLPNVDGTGITSAQKTPLAALARSIFHLLRLAGRIPDEFQWNRDAGVDMATYVYYELEKHSFFLRLCHGKWKVKKYTQEAAGGFMQDHVRKRTGGQGKRGHGTVESGVPLPPSKRLQIVRVIISLVAIHYSLCTEMDSEEEATPHPNASGTLHPPYAFGTPAPSTPPQNAGVDVPPLNGGATGESVDESAAIAKPTTSPANATPAPNVTLAPDATPAAVELVPAPSQLALDDGPFNSIEYNIQPSMPVEPTAPSLADQPQAMSAASTTNSDKLDSVYVPPRGGADKTICGRAWNKDNLTGTNREWEAYWREKGKAGQKAWAAKVRAENSAAKTAAKTMTKSKPKTKKNATVPE